MSLRSENVFSKGTNIESGFDVFWDALVKSIPEGVVISDASMKVLKATANSAFISGASWAVSCEFEHAADEITRITGKEPVIKSKQKNN